jgi:competence protein ComEC
VSERVRALHDHHVVAVAMAVAAGAYAAHPVPPLVMVLAATAACVALGLRRAALLAVALAVVASGLGANAMAGLRTPRARVVTKQWATLLTDPARLPGGSVGADVRLGRRHVRIYARAGPGEALASRLAGERVRLSGAVRPVQGVQRERLVPRHIASQMAVDAVDGWRRGNAVASVANDYRRLIERGERAMPVDVRPLFGGMVLGDDRGQTEELQDAFKAAGLTHLMVVSGQNVAFALLVASPLIRRGGLRWRLGLTVGVLFCFGVLTRWEPSVLRAEAMAAVAAAGSFAGRPVPAARLLALAVTGCVLVDPLLVRSVGFRLSVAACAGLVVLTKRLEARGVPLVLAASIGAQAGAAVVLLPTFGTVPLASLPANVLAVPVAGPLKMWGLVAGPLAGLVTPLAWVLHLPSRVMLWWVAGVARWAARLPLAPIGTTTAVVLATGCVVAALLWRRTRTRTLGGCVAGALAIFVASAAALGPVPVVAAPVQPGVVLWVVEGRSVLVAGGRVGSSVIQMLRKRRVRRLDVLVVTRPGPAAADAAWPIVQALRPRVVLAPEHHQLAGAKTARMGAEAIAGRLVVRVTKAGPPLEVEVRSRP